MPILWLKFIYRSIWGQQITKLATANLHPYKNTKQQECNMRAKSIKFIEREEITPYVHKIIDMFPNLSTNPMHAFKFSFTVLDHEFTCYSHHKDISSPELFLHDIDDVIKKCISSSKLIHKKFTSDFLQEECAIKWLKMHNEKILWRRVISYLKDVEYKTYENNRTHYNFVIKDEPGFINIATPKNFKILDQLGSSLNSYISADKLFKFISLCETDETKPTQQRQQAQQFYPSFLQQLMDSINTSDFLVTRTTKGDILICHDNQLIATKRRGKWKFYDMIQLEATITHIMTHYRKRKTPQITSAHILRILLDLSYRRHGALLIYDPNNIMPEHVQNKSSITKNAQSSDITHHIDISSCRNSLVSKIKKPKNIRRACELSSLDGATIFNDQCITAFGALIIPHEDATTDNGARSTASTSAFHYNCLPFKVSSDGDVKITYSTRKILKEKLEIELL